MNNTETRKHLLEWVKCKHGPFAWLTDACGYEQHIRFVRHRNENWHGKTSTEFIQFVVDYANSLEEEP